MLRPRLLLLAFIAAGLSGAAAAQPPFQDKLLRDHLWREIKRLPAGERPLVGLTLSAGGLRGLAHVGVLQVLTGAGFPIDIVSGTSVGAVIGSLYAGGVPVSDLGPFRDVIYSIESAAKPSTLHMFELILTGHLLSSEHMERFIRKTIGDKTFDQLGKPFACVAMDLKTGEPIIFRQGPVALAVRASMTLPGIFSPVEYRHRYLVDGGVVDYIPIDAAKLLGAEWVIASVTEGDYTKTDTTNALLTLEQVFDIRGSLIARQQRRQADIVVDSPVGDIQFYQSSRVDEAVRKGRAAMKEKLPEAEQDLILFSLPKLWRRWTGAGNR